MRSSRIIGTGLLIAALSTAGAVAQDLGCANSRQTMAVAQLMFGRSIGNKIGVTEKQWEQFLDREITPRFPDGLSIVDAQGQWRDRDRNTIVRERSKLVTIVLPGAPTDDARLKQIAEAYKRRFRQQSVGVIVRPACVSF